MNIKKRIILTILILCFWFLVIVFFYNNKSTLKIEKYNFNYNNSIQKMNKIIIVGDSRMELIDAKKHKLNIPGSVIFIARSGAKISWLYNTGIPELYKTINDDKRYKYHVVFNLGVNDLDDDVDIKELALEYYKTYKNIIEQNKEVLFYFLSVNPVDEDRIYKYFSLDNKRTNKKIEEFNNYFINFVNKEKLDNIKYCDSYNDLYFYLPDGLHYDTNTDKIIIKYIINKCVKINKNYYYKKHTLYW